ncbi:MAG: sugar transferase [Phycisphaerae bacterium]
MTVLIHFDADHVRDALSRPESVRADRCLAASSPFEWYCRWASQRTGPTFVLLPEDLKDRHEQVVLHLQDAAPLWYTDDAPLSLPEIRPKEQVWLLNGDHFPLINWQEATSVARRENSDITVFGPPEAADTARYFETVAVDDSGAVLRFSRQYCDSPGFAYAWMGSASFLATTNEHARAVMNHILHWGWGPDSIGALTRRFTIRWSTDTCVASHYEAMSTPLKEDGTPDSPATVATGRPGGTAETRVGATVVHSLPMWGSATPIEPDVADGSEHSPDGGHAVSPAESEPDSCDDRQPDRTRPGPSPSQPEAQAADYSLVDDIDFASIPDPGRAYLVAKRAMDFVLAGAGLIVLSPVLAIAALIVKLTSPGPVFYGDKRQGAGGREFLCWKFRTMFHGAETLQGELRNCNEVDGPQFKITHDPRLTRIGAFYRRYNIDELPQMINVLLGQMSFVGPRPSPDQENQICPGWRRTRLSMKPGITGLWQIMRMRGASDSDFQQWIYYDIEYARHRSLWLDTQILLHTPFVMFAPKLLHRFASSLRRRGICEHAEGLGGRQGTDSQRGSAVHPAQRVGQR